MVAIPGSVADKKDTFFDTSLLLFFRVLLIYEDER